MDRYLDAGYGSCIPKNPELRRIVSDSLEFYDGKRYHLIAYVVMPNHVHVILIFPQGVKDLSAVVGSYKAYVSKMFHMEHPGVPLWQRSFYDHVIRDEAAYLEIKRYIRENQLKWNLDEYNPNV